MFTPQNVHRNVLDNSSASLSFNFKVKVSECHHFIHCSITAVLLNVILACLCKATKYNRPSNFGRIVNDRSACVKASSPAHDHTTIILLPCLDWYCQPLSSDNFMFPVKSSLFSDTSSNLSFIYLKASYVQNKNDSLFDMICLDAQSLQGRRQRTLPAFRHFK